MLFLGFIHSLAYPPVGTVDEVNNRLWTNTTEQIQEHDNFMAFVDSDIQDNYYNNEQMDASITAYNLVTEIGKDVDGYELAALVAKKQILDDIYNPTTPERKMHEWAFFMYDIPNNSTAINIRISTITNNADTDLVNRLVDSIHRLVNIGSVSNELEETDPQYWFLLGVKNTCENDPNCDVSMLGGITDCKGGNELHINKRGEAVCVFSVTELFDRGSVP